MAEQITVNAVSVALGGTPIIHELGFQLDKGQIGCLIGPSGSGKTTVLRAIAGFEPLTGGEIIIGDHRVSRPGATLAPEKRRIGMVFQDFALFPHLNVEANIAFGLRDLKASDRRQRVSELLALVGLSDLRQSWPHQLSGGQQQRVALARAMAPRPDILLLDEPFSSIDVELREQLAREVRSILREDNITAILVTHDQFEAFAMADVIGVLHEGRLAQWDSGYNLYHRPVDRFVADFIGQGEMLGGTVHEDHVIVTELGEIQCPICHFAVNAQVDILIRPDDITIHPGTSALTAIVLDRAFRGEEYLYRLGLPSGAEIISVAPSHEDYTIGEQVGLELHIDHIVVFERE